MSSALESLVHSRSGEFKTCYLGDEDGAAMPSNSKVNTGVQTETRPLSDIKNVSELDITSNSFASGISNDLSSTKYVASNTNSTPFSKISERNFFAENLARCVYSIERMLTIKMA